MSDSVDTTAWRREADAHKRAMPLQRLIGNGMNYSDVVELYSRVGEGQSWTDVAADLGDQNHQRAKEKRRTGHFQSAQGWHLFAAACYRVGQVPLADGDPRKIEIYRKLIRDYMEAGALFDPPVEHVEIGIAGGALCGWLLRPPPPGGGAGFPPVVIVAGGFDGWREEYHVGASYLLDRGIAVLLIDAPGQGESRLFHGLHMNGAVHEAFSTVVDHVLADERLAPVVGIWGNSMGGYLAALTAASDERVAACCVTGGTIRPAEILDRYPRFIEKVVLLLGIEDPAKARSELGLFLLTPELLDQLRCPLLVLHGTPDQVFLIDNARRLFDGAASTDKAFLEWPDGDHCIYNHSHEKHAAVADWFVDKLFNHY